MVSKLRICEWSLTREPNLARAVLLTPAGETTVELDDDELAIETQSKTMGAYVPLPVLAQLWAWREEGRKAGKVAEVGL